MKSTIFHTEEYKKIEKSLKDYLNSQDKEELGITSTSGVRTAGDKTPKVIYTKIAEILNPYCSKVEFSSNRKAMYNFNFSDKEKLNYFVNIITHRMETKFNRPNITSVDRLMNLYKNDRNYFIILLISYEASKDTNFIKELHFKPIEFFSWNCLALGALGVGQIQIKKAKEVTIIQNMSRKKWIIEFSHQMNDFYIDEARKIVNRLDRAKKLRFDWNKKKDTWL